MRKIPAVFFIGWTLLLASGCSSGSGAGKTVSGWFGGSESSSVRSKGTTRYAGEAGLVVFAGPATDSKVIGKLSLHEKVTQIEQDRGFSEIRARGGKLEGWVQSHRLLKKIPAAPGSKEETPVSTDVPQSGPASGASDELPASSESDATVQSPDTEAPASDETVQHEQPAEPAKPAPPAPAEPVGPSKPRSVGASVFDPY